MSTMNYLPHHLLKAYQETLSDDSKALGSIYGAAFGVSCLGAEVMLSGISHRQSVIMVNGNVNQHPRKL